MTEKLIKNAAEIFQDNEERWLAACQLSELIPEIETHWKNEFIDTLKETIETRFEENGLSDRFKIIEDPDDEYTLFIFLISSKKNKKQCPLGLSLAIQIEEDEGEINIAIGLCNHFEGKKSEEVLENIFNKYRPLYSKYNDNKKKWNNSGWVTWSYFPLLDNEVDIERAKFIYLLNHKKDSISEQYANYISDYLLEHNRLFEKAHKDLVSTK